MFGFIGDIFTIILYQPLFNGLVLIYNYLPWHDFGLAIILLTIGIRIILYPLSVKALNSQMKLQKLQPQIKAMQEKYKNDKEKQAKETLEIYRKEKINPFSGLLLALVQLPILIALYQVFWNGLKPGELVDNLYRFVMNPGLIDPMFLGALDLSKPWLMFALVAGAVQFFQTKMLIPSRSKGAPKADDMATIMQTQMVYVMPLLTVVILFRLPSALGLYWIVSGLISIVQQYFILRKHNDDQPK